MGAATFQINRRAALWYFNNPSCSTDSNNWDVNSLSRRAVVWCALCRKMAPVIHAGGCFGLVGVEVSHCFKILRFTINGPSLISNLWIVNVIYSTGYALKLYFLLCFLFVFAMFWRFSCYLSSLVIVFMFIWYEIEHSPKVLSAPFGYFQACMVSSWIWLHFSFATFPLLSHLHNH